MSFTGFLLGGRANGGAAIGQARIVRESAAARQAFYVLAR
jgi:hypothetical protein